MAVHIIRIKSQIHVKETRVRVNTSTIESPKLAIARPCAAALPLLAYITLYFRVRELMTPASADETLRGALQHTERTELEGSGGRYTECCGVLFVCTLDELITVCILVSSTSTSNSS